MSYLRRKHRKQKTKALNYDYIVKLQFENLVFERRIGYGILFG